MIRHTNAKSTVAQKISEPVNPMAMELAFWRSISQHSAPELRAYLDRYPGGHFIPLAKLRIAKIEAEVGNAITIHRIMELVSEKSGVPMLGLKSPRRARRYAYARFVALELARQFTTCTMPQISVQFGRRDRTMVSHASKTLENMRLLKNRPACMQAALDLYEECKAILSNEGELAA